MDFDRQIFNGRRNFYPPQFFKQIALSDLDRNIGEWPQTWLVVDWPEGDAAPYHHYLAWFQTKPTPQRCLRLRRGRFAIEQFFQHDQPDLGLDHDEGRSWQGFHHHLVPAAVADLFVLVISLRSKKTSGVTWEQVLPAIQPWLVRWIGCCPCCGKNFEPKFYNFT